MSARKAIQEIVDQLTEPELVTATTLLRALRKGVPAEEIEDALDSHDLRRLRQEQANDELEPLDAFGKRVRL